MALSGLLQRLELVDMHAARCTAGSSLAGTGCKCRAQAVMGLSYHFGVGRLGR